VTGAAWEPSEGSWRDTQRRARAHLIQLLRTEPDDGPVRVLAVSGSEADPVLRLFRDPLAVTAMLDAADAACIANARARAERRP